MDVVSSPEALSGTLRLTAFILTFPSVLAITGSSCPVATFISPVMAAHVTSAFSGLDSPVFSPSCYKTFVVGPGHVPIPAKLISKMIGGQFMDFPDLFPANLHSVTNDPQTFLEGMLLVLNKCQVLEIKDILKGLRVSQSFKWWCAQPTLINDQTWQNINFWLSKLLIYHQG